MYHFVSKSEVQKYRSVCSQRLQELRAYLQKELAVKSQVLLFGSAATGLFTQNGDQCIDLDYNIRIEDLPTSVQLKKLKDVSMNKLNKLFSEPQWSGAQDSTSVITLAKKDENGKVVFRLDIAFILPNINGTACRLVHNKQNGLYTWNEIPQYKGIQGKEEQLKEAGLWDSVRETYLAKKNMYLERNDNEHFSYIVYVEAVNEVFQNQLPELDKKRSVTKAKNSRKKK